MTQKLACQVEQIVNHGDRVYTVALRPEGPAPRFRAGQFLHLALDHYDPSRFWPDSRVFSIASPPSQPDLLRISYSVRGRFTERMERELVEGQQVWIKMPYGDFVVGRGTDVVLLAGGTGISAFTAFLESLPHDGMHSVTLAYGARTDRLLIYRDAVERCAMQAPSMRAVYFVEDLAPDGGSTDTSDTQVGRVSVAAMWPRLSRPFEAAYYISGPPAMLRTVSDDLRAHGITSEAIHIDAWE
ncbi:MAG: FAD-dependent oxidoreductase [Vicinamibacteria bacterium]|nr:FAD-dependent oxidoreductase [Vicinamibacteria bacterium]